MGKEKIRLKNVNEKCPKCGLAELVFHKEIEATDKFEFSLKCPKCDFVRNEIIESFDDEDIIQVFLINASSHEKNNLWLISAGKKMYFIKAPKASVPPLDSIPEEFRDLTKAIFGDFFLNNAESLLN